MGWIARCFNFFDQDGECIRRYNPCMEDEKEKTREPEKSKKIFFIKFYWTNVVPLAHIEKLKSNVAKKIIISSRFSVQKSREKSVAMDYGNDGWSHEFTLEKTRYTDKKHYPKCIAGKSWLHKMATLQIFTLHFNS